MSCIPPSLPLSAAAVLQQAQGSRVERLHAADAQQTIKVLKSVLNAATLADLEARRLLLAVEAVEHLHVAASQPQYHAAYCNIVGQQQHVRLLIQVTCKLMKLFSGQITESSTQLGILAGLCGALAGVLIHNSKWQCYGFRKQDTIKVVMETGVLARAMEIATQVTAYLNNCSQTQTDQQQPPAQQPYLQCTFANALLGLWQGLHSLCDDSRVLDLSILSTIEQVAGLALAVLRLGQDQPATLLEPVYSTMCAHAASDALSVAWRLTTFLAVMAVFEQYGAVAQKVLAAVDVQQVLLVHLASLAAGLHHVSNGQCQVSISGSGEAATRLDTPAWHDRVLTELSTGWVKQSPQERCFASLSGSDQDSGVPRCCQHLYKALAAVYFALKYGRSTGSTQLLQSRMSLPLMRMFIEVSALMPETGIVYHCIGCSLMLFATTSVLTIDSSSVEFEGSFDVIARRDQAARALVSAGSDAGFTAATAAALLPPVLNLLVPAVLHVLSLDSQSGFERYKALPWHGSAPQSELTITRLGIMENLSAILLPLVLELEPKHLAAVVFHKPLTSLSILEAMIRTVTADAVVLSSTDTSIGNASQSIRQHLQAADPGMRSRGVATSSLLAQAIEVAAANGKFEVVLSAPPGDMQALQWEGLFCKQLTGLMVTCIKLQQVLRATGAPSAVKAVMQDMQIKCTRSILLSVSHLGMQLSSKIAAETPAGDGSGAAGSSGNHCSDKVDAVKLCVAVAGRALRLLGLILHGQSPATGHFNPSAPAATPKVLQQANVAATKMLLSGGTSQVAIAAAKWAVGQLLAWGGLPQSTQKQLLQQHGLLISTLKMTTQLGSTCELMAAEQGQLRQLPELLKMVGSLVSAWVPQQQWCHSAECCDRSMLRENALVCGEGKVCAGCRVVRYCARECQVQDWKQHKHVCKAWQEARP